MYTANSERDEFNIITSDRLSIVAQVQAVDQPLENIDPAQRLVVYCENGVPVALSEPADVVLYTPAASVADLLIYESDRDASSGDNVPDDDILAMVSGIWALKADVCSWLNRQAYNDTSSRTQYQSAGRGLGWRTSRATSCSSATL